MEPGNEPRRGRKSKLSDEQKIEIIKRWKAGEPTAVICKDYGICASTVDTMCKRTGARRPEKKITQTGTLNEFAKRVRSVLWHQDIGSNKVSYDKWEARVKELQSADGAAYSRGQALVCASKEFPCLYRLFREYDLASYDPNPESHPMIKHYGLVANVKEVHCENKEMSHRDNLNWAIAAAGEFLRTGKMPSICPNNAAWYLFIQAREEPKEFLSRFNQIESKSDDGVQQRQARQFGQRSIQELEAMLKELTTDEQRSYTEEALREMSDGEVRTEEAEEEK